MRLLFLRVCLRSASVAIWRLRYFVSLFHLNISPFASSCLRRPRPPPTVVCFSGTVTSSTQLLSAMNSAVLPHLGQTRHKVTLSCSAWLLRGGSSARLWTWASTRAVRSQSDSAALEITKKKKKERWKFNESQLRATTAKQYTLFSVATCV